MSSTLALLAIFLVEAVVSAAPGHEFPTFANTKGAPPIAVGTWYLNKNALALNQETQFLNLYVYPDGRRVHQERGNLTVEGVYTSWQCAQEGPGSWWATFLAKTRDANGKLVEANKVYCEAGYREPGAPFETLNFWVSDLECPPGDTGLNTLVRMPESTLTKGKDMVDLSPEECWDPPEPEDPVYDDGALMYGAGHEAEAEHSQLHYEQEAEGGHGQYHYEHEAEGEHGQHHYEL